MFFSASGGISSLMPLLKIVSGNDTIRSLNFVIIRNTLRVSPLTKGFPGKLLTMSHKNVRFIFSGGFDTEYLWELYDNDINTIMEMFGSSIEAIRAEVTNSIVHFRDGDPEALRRVFHKIRPVFSYVGLNYLQEQVHDFENKCSLTTGTESLSSDYERLVSMVYDAMSLLEQELERMKKFTNLKVS